MYDFLAVLPLIGSLCNRLHVLYVPQSHTVKYILNGEFCLAGLENSWKILVIFIISLYYSMGGTYLYHRQTLTDKNTVIFEQKNLEKSMIF